MSLPEVKFHEKVLLLTTIIKCSLNIYKCSKDTTYVFIAALYKSIDFWVGIFVFSYFLFWAIMAMTRSHASINTVCNIHKLCSGNDIFIPLMSAKGQCTGRHSTYVRLMAVGIVYHVCNTAFGPLFTIKHICFLTVHD